MTKSELVDAIAARAPGIPKRDVETAVHTVFESMSQALAAGERIEIRGFGSFVAKRRRPRSGRNPKTGVAVSVPQKQVPFFTAGKELRDRVNTGAGPRPGAAHGPASTPASQGPGAPAALVVG